MSTYPTGIVGERNYQDAIARCIEGEPVQVCHEIDNPYDKLALRVENARGEIIGYIGRDSWIRDCIHDEGRGCVATIRTIAVGETGMLGVVLNVMLSDEQVHKRRYGVAAHGRSETIWEKAAAQAGKAASAKAVRTRPKSAPGNFIAGFFRGLFK